MDSGKKAFRARRPTGIVCKPYKFVYFPTPKVASDSMKNLIADLCGLSVVAGSQIKDAETIPAHKLNNLHGYKSLAVVRNPWSRLHSCYKHKISEFQGGTELRHGFNRYNKLLGYQLFSLDMSFEDFIKIVSLIPDSFADEHFRSQIRFLSYPKNKLLPQRIAHLENFNNEVYEIMSEFGVKDVMLPHTHSTTPTDYRDFYSKKMAELVSKRYKDDIAMFNYKF